MATFVVMCFSLTTHSQNSNELWTSVSEMKAKGTEQVSRKIELKTEKYFQLDIDALKSALQNVGNRENIGNTVISFPNSDGKLNKFRVFEASIMESELQEQFPNIRSYAGQGIDNPSEIIRFSITPKGLHAMFLGTSSGTQFIDPFSEDGDIYTVYSKKNLKARNFDFECGVIDNDLMNRAYEESISMARNANDGLLRDYRLAVACTGEYAAFHGGTVAGALAAIVVTITRVNSVFERDLSITMTLVGNNSSILFTNATTDPFNNDSTNVLIGQSQSVINSTIGASNYDVGHTFSTGAGGLAGLGVTCNTNQKASGVTGISSPVGDAFDIDFVAHELGHQFGAPHTFNGNVGNCAGGNRSASNAYEPGSGSTIMAYAGICGSDNIQIGSDAYFHQGSLNRIWNHVLSTGACPVNRTPTGNIEPVAAASGTNFNIPQGTPYKLDGSNSTDADGLATLTYTWEQYDLGPSGLPTETTSSGPLVRSFEGTSNPVRYVPRLSDIILSGGISTTWEKLATVSRNINYRLTVRDNDARGGQTDDVALTATVRAAAGPFIVTSQNTSGISWDIGSTQTVTWDVAGTTGNNVNEANVNILLSTDGGLTFDTVLASNTPNDGSHNITVPNVASSNCRIMVEAANSIFFNVNSNNFAIGVTIDCTTYSDSNVNLAIADGTGTTGPANGPPLVRTLNVPDNVTIESVKFNVDISHTYVGDLLVRLTHPDGTTQVNVWSGNCTSNDDILIEFEDGAAAIDCALTGAGNTYNPVEPLSAFTGLNAQGDWTILIADFFSGDTGTLNNWSIEICTETLSIEDNELSELTIYPNPNNGEFNIGFNPQSGEAISIDVYDIRGRKIYGQSFNNVGRFDEVIQLNNAQSGVYMLMISDGAQKVTKKIIVE